MQNAKLMVQLAAGITRLKQVEDAYLKIAIACVGLPGMDQHIQRAEELLGLVIRKRKKNV